MVKSRRDQIETINRCLFYLFVFGYFFYSIKHLDLRVRMLCPKKSAAYVQISLTTGAFFINSIRAKTF